MAPLKSRLGVRPHVSGGCTLLIARAYASILASLVLVFGVGGHLAAMTVLIVTMSKRGSGCVAAPGIGTHQTGGDPKPARA